MHTAAAALTLALVLSQADAKLYISEYIEGSKNALGNNVNQAIEIYNDGTAAVNLADYRLLFHKSGKTDASKTHEFVLSHKNAAVTTLAGRSTHVVCNEDADAALKDKADQTETGDWFTGNDVIILKEGADTRDSIGKTGFKPTSPGYYVDTNNDDIRTRNRVLRRVVPVELNTDVTLDYVMDGKWTATNGADFSDVGRFSDTLPFIGISEYVEGNGGAALELFNDRSTTLELTGYKLEFYFDGASTAGTTITLTGSIAPHATHVVTSTSASAALKAKADSVVSATFFDGNDAVVLRDGGNSVVDSIGRINENPGSYWGTTGLKTQNLGLRRVSPAAADTVATNAYDTAGVWEAASHGDYSDLGRHIDSRVFLYISEYVEGGGGDGTNRAIELFNGGSCEVDLTGYQLNFYKNEKRYATVTIELSGTIGVGKTHVIAKDDTGIVPSPQVDELKEGTVVGHGGTFQKSTLKFPGGNDAVALRSPALVLLDSIGEVGANPPDGYWTDVPEPATTLKTKNMALHRRQPVVLDRNLADTYTVEPSQWAGASGATMFDSVGVSSDPYYVSLPSNECTNDGLHRGMGELYLTYATQADCCNALPREKRAVCLKTATKVSPDYEQGKCVEGNPRRVTYPSCVVSGTGSATHVSSRFLRPSLAVATPSSCCAAMYGELGADAVRKCESERGTWHVISGGHCLRDGPLDDDPMMHATTRFESDNSVAGWNTCLTAHFKRSTKFTCADHVCSGSFTAKSSSIHCGASQADCTNELCCEKVCA
eukprot:Rhum_TRINITY_DN14365_c0_g1::Rhum_TRINITY_DN14365_c0_g1_i4::g.83077::m.83077